MTLIIGESMAVQGQEICKSKTTLKESLKKKKRIRRPFSQCSLINKLSFYQDGIWGQNIIRREWMLCVTSERFVKKCFRGKDEKMGPWLEHENRGKA